MDDFGYSAPGLDLAEEGAAFVKAGRAAIEVAELERKLAELQREVQGSLASDAVREAFGLEEGDGGVWISFAATVRLTQRWRKRSRPTGARCVTGMNKRPEWKN